jgi:hypothetical protein
MGACALPKLESSLNTLPGEASWLLSHARALADYGRKEEADAELARAVNCMENYPKNNGDSVNVFFGGSGL